MYLISQHTQKEQWLIDVSIEIFHMSDLSNLTRQGAVVVRATVTLNTRLIYAVG